MPCVVHLPQLLKVMTIHYYWRVRLNFIACQSKQQRSVRPKITIRCRSSLPSEIRCMGLHYFHCLLISCRSCHSRH